MKSWKCLRARGDVKEACQRIVILYLVGQREAGMLGAGISWVPLEEGLVGTKN